MIAYFLLLHFSLVFRFPSFRSQGVVGPREELDMPLTLVLTILFLSV